MGIEGPEPKGKEEKPALLAVCDFGSEDFWWVFHFTLRPRNRRPPATQATPPSS